MTDTLTDDRLAGAPPWASLSSPAPDAAAPPPTERELVEALRQGRFLLLYQPRIDLVSHRTVAFEALARLRCGDGRLASASEFVDTLERGTEVRLAFTRWMIGHIAQLQLRRAAAGESLLPISMNLPAVAIDASSTLAEAAVELTHRGLPPGLLRAELVERELSQLTAPDLREIEGAADAGAFFELDDFGSAESNFDLLPQLPIITLKLAGTMTAEVASDPRRERLVASMVKFAESYGVRLCSEQVETRAQLLALERLGVPEVQGFYLSHPLDETGLSGAIARQWLFD